MRQQKIMLILLIYMCVGDLAQARIDKQEALDRVKTFTHNGKKKLKSSFENSSALEVVGDTEKYIIVNAGAGGLVVVNAEEVTPTPILAYGLENKDGRLNPTVKALLDSYADNTSSNNYLYGIITPVEPLLGNIAWNQRGPYNDACPTYESSYGVEHSPAGCVAIALGQIMAYHKYPAEYAWDKILDDYGTGSPSAEEKNEIARLIYDIGKAVKMKYGRDESGATSSDAWNAIKETFGYSDTPIYRNYSTGGGLGGSVLDRWSVSPCAYEALIYQELQQGRPVYLNGTSKSNSGHAFVCDGNDEMGYLHINWGWGGVSNGYFSTAMLNPSLHGIGGSDSGYNTGKGIIYGIAPESTDWNINLYSYFRNFTPASDGSTYTIETVRESGYSYIGEKNEYKTVYWGLRILDSEGHFVKDVGAKALGEKDLEQYTLPNGEYHIYPIWRQNEKCQWQYIWPIPTEHPFALMTVENGVRRCEKVNIPTQTELVAEFISVPELLMMPEKVESDAGQVIFKLINNGAASLYNNVCVVLTNIKDGTKSSEVAIDCCSSLSHGQYTYITVPVQNLFDSSTKLIDGDTYTVDVVYNNNGVLTVAGSSAPMIAKSRGFSADLIKDENLRLLLRQVADKNRDGYFNDYELFNSPQVIELGNRSVKSLEGIEGFYKTVTIWASGNDLKEVNIKNMPNLMVINVDNNDNLTQFSVTGCPKLTDIYASYCNIEDFRLDQALSELNLSISNNQLTSLKLDEIGSLELDCANNLLGELIIDENTILKKLYCFNNSLENLNLPHNLTELIELRCSNNKIGSINLQNACNLKVVSVVKNNLTTLNVSGCTSLVTLDASDNRISDLNIKDCTNIEDLSVSHNHLSDLDISELRRLKSLSINLNQFLFFNAPANVEYYNEWQRVPVYFDGTVFDLTPYIEKGLDLSKLMPRYYCKLEGSFLLLGFERTCQYYYDNVTVDLIDIDSPTSIDKITLCLENIGDKGVVKFTDPGYVGCDIKYSTDGIVDCLETEWTDEPYTTAYKFTRLEDGDCDIYFETPGHKTLVCHVTHISGVDIVEAEEAYPVEYYDITGRRITQPSANSVTIVKMSDNSVRKIMVTE